MHKTKPIHWYDVVRNLVVDFELLYVCLFVYMFVCTSRFANFARGKWSNHDSKNCSEIMTVTWTVIWLWKLQFTTSIFFTPL